MRDLHDNIKSARAISPFVATTNAAIVSQIIDRQLYDSLEFVINTGTLASADATFVTLIEDGDAANLSDAATVIPAHLLGTVAAASFIFSDDDKSFRIGYIGNKRYVRLTITPTGTAGNAAIGAVAILGNAHSAPTTNP